MIKHDAKDDVSMLKTEGHFFNFEEVVMEVSLNFSCAFVDFGDTAELNFIRNLLHT